MIRSSWSGYNWPTSSPPALPQDWRCHPTCSCESISYFQLFTLYFLLKLLNQTSSWKFLRLETLHTQCLLHGIFWFLCRICQKSTSEYFHFFSELVLRISFKANVKVMTSIHTKCAKRFLNCPLKISLFLWKSWSFMRNNKYFDWNLAGILCRQIEIIWHFWQSCKTYLIPKRWRQIRKHIKSKSEETTIIVILPSDVEDKLNLTKFYIMMIGAVSDRGEKYLYLLKKQLIRCLPKLLLKTPPPYHWSSHHLHHNHHHRRRHHQDHLEERSSRESVKTLLDLFVERKAEAALKSSSKSETGKLWLWF